MAHVQQLALDAIAIALTATGVRVFVDRVDPLTLADLPCILVQEDDPETVEVIGADSHESLVQSRILTASIKCVPLADDTAVSARALGLAVEIALQSNAALRYLMSGYEIVSSDYAQRGEAEYLFNQRVQIWKFTYTTKSDKPDAFI